MQNINVFVISNVLLLLELHSFYCAVCAAFITGTRSQLYALRYVMPIFFDFHRTSAFTLIAGTLELNFRWLLSLLLET